MRELLSVEVLADLLGSDDFPAEVLDTEAAAKIILQRLSDAGFKVTVDEQAAGMKEVLRLRAEIERLEAAKRRALQLADERAKEAVELRRQVEHAREMLGFHGFELKEGTSLAAAIDTAMSALIHERHELRRQIETLQGGAR